MCKTYFTLLHIISLVHYYIFLLFVSGSDRFSCVFTIVTRFCMTSTFKQSFLVTNIGHTYVDEYRWPSHANHDNRYLALARPTCMMLIIISVHAWLRLYRNDSN